MLAHLIKSKEVSQAQVAAATAIPRSTIKRRVGRPPSHQQGEHLETCRVLRRITFSFHAAGDGELPRRGSVKPKILFPAEKR